MWHFGDIMLKVSLVCSILTIFAQSGPRNDSKYRFDGFLSYVLDYTFNPLDGEKGPQKDPGIVHMSLLENLNYWSGLEIY